MTAIDRKTGEILSADPFTYITTYEGYDLKTGRPKLNPKLPTAPGKVAQEVCPTNLGGKDWQPTAWSPKTKLLYIPHSHACMNRENFEVQYIAGTPYIGLYGDQYAAPGDGHRGAFDAWDPLKHEKAWSIEEKFPVFSGALATAGDVVFYGTLDRWFKAVDAKTGKLLWKFRAPSGIVGQPITYAVGGKQYVAVLSGIGGAMGGVVIGNLDPRLRNGGQGTSGLIQDLAAYTEGGSTLLVFSLPEGAAGK